MLHTRSRHGLVFRRVALALFATGGLSACAGHTVQVETPSAALSADERIARALLDAAEADPDEVVNDLIALTPEQPSLSWRRDEAGEPWVQLVAWTDWDGYQAQVGQTVPLGRAIWVTAAPEVQEFCRGTGLTGEALNERLTEYLGIRPGAGKPYFVTLWARPSTVVRPCADPSVSATTCAASDVAEDVQLGTHAHRAWFDDLRGRSYGEGGYPWTRLGYTYDWAAGASERGASEFVIPAQTSVEIVAFTTTDEYCR
ncbi:MAG: hypothetical protein IPL19_24365 [Sandaracinaceae bacterium]|nr:hypothetical protein [Sandaracinaceae bacterium]MBK8411085.1 hypothetical protein [Sandaracinaceae bacterium]MBP7681985.1 hypothetical protein [Deltaproteobacteria bacterium]